MYSHPLVSIGVDKRIPSAIDPTVFGNVLVDVLINRGHVLARILNDEAAKGIEITKEFAARIPVSDAQNPLYPFCLGVIKLVQQADVDNPSPDEFRSRIERGSRMLPRLSEILGDALVARDYKQIPVVLSTLNSVPEWQHTYFELKPILCRALVVKDEDLVAPDAVNLGKAFLNDAKVHAAIAELQNWESLMGQFSHVGELTFEALKSSIDALPEYCADMKRSLNLLVIRAEAKADTAEHLITEFYAEANAWLDRSTDRLSGWYKRQARVIGLGAAILLSGFANIDTINLLNTLSSNPAIREKAAVAAVSSAQRWEVGGSDALTAKYENTDCITIRGILKQWGDYNQAKAAWDKNAPHAQADAAPALPKQSLTAEQLQMTLVCTKSLTSAVVADLNVSGLQVGWTQKQFNLMNEESGVKWGVVWLKWLLGILISAFAITLGGEFWFKQIQEIVRLTGKTKAKS